MFDSAIKSNHIWNECLEDGEVSHAPVTVFLDQPRFEAGITRILEPITADIQDCAILHVAVEAGVGTSHLLGHTEAGAKMLKLIGRALRSGIRSGALAYLGDAKFAVLLQGADVKDTLAYSRAVLSAIEETSVPWGDNDLSVSAYIGGVMAGGLDDGVALLSMARAAGRIARDKGGVRVHMYREEYEEQPHSLEQYSTGACLE